METKADEIQKGKAPCAPFAFLVFIYRKGGDSMALLSFALIILFIWVAYDIVFNDKGDC